MDGAKLYMKYYTTKFLQICTTYDRHSKRGRIVGVQNIRAKFIGVIGDNTLACLRHTVTPTRDTPL